MISDMIKTGADIIDIDHRVTSVSSEVKLLSAKQVFSGNCDPVSVIQDGDEKRIRDCVVSFFNQASRRSIVSAGCEITPETTPANLSVFSKTAQSLKQ